MYTNNEIRLHFINNKIKLNIKYLVMPGEWSLLTFTAKKVNTI